MPAKTFNVGLLHYFILQKRQLPLVPFVDPVLKIYIYCESSVRSREGAWGAQAPLIVTLKWGPRGWKKCYFGTPPPAYLMIWMTRPLSYLKVWIRHWNPCFLDSKIQIWIFLAKKCTLRFNPLNLNSDQQQSSPNNVNTWLRKKVMRIINKMISLGNCFDLQMNYLSLFFKELYRMYRCQSREFVCWYWVSKG